MINVTNETKPEKLPEIKINFSFLYKKREEAVGRRRDEATLHAVRSFFTQKSKTCCVSEMRSAEMAN
jgi:hypothetical protein